MRSVASGSVRTTRRLRSILLAAACLALLPTLTFAQGTASIAGVVRDATDAVLPGVTVEVESPALIERTRTAITDGTGQYNVVSLPPGVYSVTFTLPGFATVKREGIELTTGFAAKADAAMKVGELNETVTVSGASPVVDVQNVNRQTVMTREIVEAIPSGRSYQELASLVPGITMTDAGNLAPATGGSTGIGLYPLVSANGGRTGDLKIQLNGLDVNAFTANRFDRSYMNIQAGQVQEFAISYSSASAESETGGVVTNMISREGANSFSTNMFANFSNGSFQSDNITDELRAKGVGDADKQKTLYTVNPSVGGPVVRDKLWFYAALSRQVTERYVADTYVNLDITAFRPVLDLNQQAFKSEKTWEQSGRLTWQATPKNKLSLLHIRNRFCQCPYDPGLKGGRIQLPEAATMNARGGDITQGMWTAPLTNRLLLETVTGRVGQFKLHDAFVPLKAPAIQEATGYVFRAPLGGSWFDEDSVTYMSRSSVSYVTGTHNVKIGGSALLGNNQYDLDQFGNIIINTLNYRPTSATYYATPNPSHANMRQLGVFAQDQWRVSRFTANLGIRWEYYEQRYPDINLPPVEFVPITRTFPGAVLVNWKDVWPRVGVAYDVFGDGKTAIKGSLGQFPVLFGLLSAHPARSNNSTTRSWTDPNGDFIIQGNPLNPAANGELGPSTNLAFGQPGIRTKYDPNYAFGFGKRQYNWEGSMGMQHELVPGVGLNATWYRRSFGNFEVTDNLLITAADFDPFCVTSPVNPGLPGGGGQQICGLFDLQRAKVGLTDNLIRSSADIADRDEHWVGGDVTVQARFRNGGLVQGGLSTGRTTTDSCELARNLDNPGQLNCRVVTPFLTQVKLVGAYTLPYDVQLSATVQSSSGVVIRALTSFTNAQIAPSLGRNLSSSATVNLEVIAPNTVFGDRMTQLDLRFAKIFRMGRFRMKGMLDLYNALNTNTIIAVNNNYGTTGATWQAPQDTVFPRLIQVAPQIDF